jgi:hypothetical protein
MSVYHEFTFPFLEIPYQAGDNSKSFHTSDHNLTNEVALSGVIISLLMIAFAKEKQEDEFIDKVRLESLQWAVLVNYLLLLIATWLIHGWGFIEVMMYNMLTVLIIFIVRFNYVLSRSKQLK